MKIECQQRIELLLVGRMCFLQTVYNGVAEAFKLGVISGIKTLLFDKFPKALNQIEIGRIGRQEKEFDVKLRGKLSDELCALITRIIQNQCHRHRKVEARNLPEKIANTLAVNVSVIDNGDEFMIHCVQRSEHVEPLPARRGLEPQPCLAPEISQEGG